MSTDGSAARQDYIAHLIRQVAAGDRAAFTELYRTTSDVLFGVLVRILRNRTSAEDGLQEVFARIWLRAGTFAETRGTGITWLITIARNHAIDLRRHRAAFEFNDVDVDTIAASGRSPDALLMAQDMMDRIRACLCTLEPRQADCIRRAYLDGASYADLALRHSVPLNTMRTWLRRGLQKLRACMAD